MFYVILGILVAAALFLILRDDHDTSYNRNERKPSVPSLKNPVHDAPKTVQKIEEELVEPDDEAEAPDLSFLDTLVYDEELEENTETFDIAGLRYNCTIQDCGPIAGIVKPEPSNPHDPRAQAVIRSDGKLLGYIPRTQLDWYEGFNEEGIVCPFVGEIELDRASASLTAEIKVILPVSREYVEDEILEGV